VLSEINFDLHHRSKKIKILQQHKLVAISSIYCYGVLYLYVGHGADDHAVGLGMKERS
jgi:hypothetical protein